MNQDKYILIREKHFRATKIDGDPQPRVERFNKGDVLIPTDGELRYHRNIFDGPVNADTPLGPQRHVEAQAAATGPQTITERALEILRSPVANLRDEIRKIDDENLLLAMQQQETQKETPRKQVLEMIDRKRQSFASVTT